MMQNVSGGTEAELARLIDGEIDPKKFPHSEHLRFAYEMLSRHSFAETVSLFSAGLKKLAVKSGRPELYHDTITIAYLSLVAERRAQSQAGEWAAFIAENGDLLEKSCLERWYERRRLTSDLARQNFVLPLPSRLSGKAMRAIHSYLIVYAALIIWASAVTIWRALGHQADLVWLGSVEIAAALFFVAKRTRLVGLTLLLAVYVIATVVESVSGGLPIRFLIYGASALLVWRLTSLLEERAAGA
jgi:hypothetical protein